MCPADVEKATSMRDTSTAVRVQNAKDDIVLLNRHSYLHIHAIHVLHIL